MAGGIDIYPFQDMDGLIRFGAQACVFIVGLYLANKLIIQPALRLHAERVRRTTGNAEFAKSQEERAYTLEHDYFTRLKLGAEEARRLRTEKIQLTEQEAARVVADAEKKASEIVTRAQSRIAEELSSARLKVASEVDSLVDIIRKRVGLACALIGFFLGNLFWPLAAHAAGPGGSSVWPESFWYGIFWPYFQLAVFVGAITYFARKPVQTFLGKKRDELRSKLAEAHQAVVLAERKVKSYEDKLRSLQVEVEDLKTQNLLDAKIESEKILADAKKLSQVILADAERMAHDAVAQARDEVRQELLTVALERFEKGLTQDNVVILHERLKKQALGALAGGEKS